MKQLIVAEQDDVESSVALYPVRW